jgi:hypothetical protein
MSISYVAALSPFHLYAGPSDHIGFYAGYHTPAQAKAAVKRRADGLDLAVPRNAPDTRMLQAHPSPQKISSTS